MQAGTRPAAAYCGAAELAELAKTDPSALVVNDDDMATRARPTADMAATRWVYRAGAQRVDGSSAMPTSSGRADLLVPYVQTFLGESVQRVVNAGDCAPRTTTSGVAVP